MAQITPQQVKELREKTGAGMGDCKKALVETDGNMEEAIEALRKKGAASAAKRADRSAKEGLLGARTSEDGKLAVIVEVNCETDFVARNEEFIKYVDAVANAVLENEVDNMDSLLALKVGDDTIQGLHNGVLAKFSEKIEISRFQRMKTDGFFTDYVHAGSKLAVIVEFSAKTPNDAAKTLARDVAMQVAAMNPTYIDKDSVPQDVKDKELAIYKEQAVDSGKKDDIADRIANGKLEKYFQENCLVNQVFVKDSNKKVSEVVEEIGSESGEETKVLSFKRYFLGESES